MENMVINPSFWRGKKVFLTGNTGFKGSWLSLWLTQMGAEVFGYALPPNSRPNLFDVASISNVMSTTYADVSNYEAVFSALRASRASIVIHMAAQPLVRKSYESPVYTFTTNVMGSVHVLDAVTRCPSVKVVLNVTTDKCYENHESLWGYRETDRLGGYDPYSCSKACSELISDAYRSSFLSKAEHPVHLATARAGNVIGGGDWSSERLLSDLAFACMGRQAIRIRRPKAIRPWQHVLDALSGYLILCEQLYNGGSKFAEAWNFGPLDREVITVEAVVDKFFKYWGDAMDSDIHFEDSGPHETEFLSLDTSKAHKRLGWRPKLNIDEAIELTVDWIRRFKDGESPMEVTLDQIDRYQRLTS